MLTACHTSDALRAFLAGQLPPEEERAVASHVDGCVSCEREVERLSDDAAARALLGEHRRSVSDHGELPPEVIELGQRLQVWGWCGGAADEIFSETPTNNSDLGGTPTGHSARAAEAPPPPTVGKFEIIRRIGGGGFGVVYLARDQVLQRQVALKLARSSVLADPDLKGRFLREAEALARLAHPNIVPVYEAGDEDGTCFLAMSFCDKIGRAS